MKVTNFSPSVASFLLQIAGASVSAQRTRVSVSIGGKEINFLISIPDDSHGQRASMTDVSGATTYHYDVRDRLIEKDTPEGTLTYGYDANGNLLSIQSSNGSSLTYAYDAVNRIVSVRDAATGTTTYGYDAVGNLKTVTYPNGVATNYNY